MHYFKTDIGKLSLPEKFTYPFYYIPHPLCQIAAKEVHEFLKLIHPCENKGKMYGVLLVTDNQGKVGYLVAYSGQSENTYNYFVPPIYDITARNSFFRHEEQKISSINKMINELISYVDKEHLSILEKQKEIDKILHTSKQALETARILREAKRQMLSKDMCKIKQLNQESSFQKAEHKRLKLALNKELELLKEKWASYQTQIITLKNERKKRSAKLQQEIFRRYIIHNARGESKNVAELFPNTQAPAATGDCAAPKLLQFAYLNMLRPIAMAEFWWGASPESEIRNHLSYYPSCQEKCKPLLTFMLQGLNVEQNPLESVKNTQIELLYEDDYMFAVCKPAGILCVAGKNTVLALPKLVASQYPHLADNYIVHRIDMATSGVVLFAKTQIAYKILQRLFLERKINKCYIAILDGVISTSKGEINLPLCLDIHDRPRQMVNYTHGKRAITYYQVIKQTDNHTWVALYPHTGRTHQLRVHCAHKQGLNASILGDTLYGTNHCSHPRMYLHAESVQFIHPWTQTNIIIQKNVDKDIFPPLSSKNY